MNTLAGVAPERSGGCDDDVMAVVMVMSCVYLPVCPPGPLLRCSTGDRTGVPEVTD